jgi:hypothetical protein
MMINTHKKRSLKITRASDKRDTSFIIEAATLKKDRRVTGKRLSRSRTSNVTTDKSQCAATQLDSQTDNFIQTTQTSVQEKARDIWHA